MLGRQAGPEVNVPAIKSNDLSLSPRTDAAGEMTPTVCPLTSTSTTHITDTFLNVIQQ